MIDRFLMRLATTMASLFAALLVVAAALVFLLGAAYLALLEVASPPLAALATGLGALVFAVSIVIAGRALSRGRRAPARRRASGSEDEDLGGYEKQASELAGMLGVDIASLARTHTRSTLAVSLVAGFAVGASPRLRKALLDIVAPR
jgi:hypothetical protein